MIFFFFFFLRPLSTVGEQQTPGKRSIWQCRYYYYYFFHAKHNASFFCEALRDNGTVQALGGNV
jgi:hypothetical protein